MTKAMFLPHRQNHRRSPNYSFKGNKNACIFVPLTQALDAIISLRIRNISYRRNRCTRQVELLGSAGFARCAPVARFRSDQTSGMLAQLRRVCTEYRVRAF